MRKMMMMMTTTTTRMRMRMRMKVRQVILIEGEWSQKSGSMDMV
jgi:hypothetical protein